MQRNKLRIAIIAISSCLCSAIVSWALSENSNILTKASLSGLAGGFGAVIGIFLGRWIK